MLGIVKIMNRAERRRLKSKKKNSLRKVNGMLVSNENPLGLVSKSAKRKG